SAPMGAAPLLKDAQGGVAWDAMWQGFCELALAGGPPHRGTLLEPVTRDEALGDPEGGLAVRRGNPRGTPPATGGAPPEGPPGGGRGGGDGGGRREGRDANLVGARHGRGERNGARGGPDALPPGRPALQAGQRDQEHRDGGRQDLPLLDAARRGHDDRSVDRD